jgi:hypothetical protein
MHADPLALRPRARLLTVSLLLALLGGLVHTAAAAAQAVPTLAGAALVAEVTTPGQIFETAGECDPTGESTFTFDASGSASGGDVSGTFTEIGTVTLGPAPPVGPMPVTAFEASFTIQTANGYTITGTKRLAATRSALCRPDGPEGRLVNFSVDLEYEAAITGPGGSFAVSGTATARGTDGEPGTSFPDGIAQFQQTFITSTPIELGPVSLDLRPPDAIEPVETEHCIVASVRNVFGHAMLSGTVRFIVTGVSGLTGSAHVESGEAEFCFVGPPDPGVDTIRAFADANGNGSEDAGEPADETTVTWVPVHRPPASLTVDPATATHPVGAEHCVTATVLNTIGEPSIGVRVRFTVLGAARPSASAPSDVNGTASFCYTGPSSPATDTIRVFADVDDDGFHDSSEPSAVATATFEAVARPAASVALDPDSATRIVGAVHCLTATVLAASGEPADPVVVRFAVSGASSAGDAVTAGEDGIAELCYTGPALPGSDTIRAFADTDGDGIEGAGEPAATAAATFVLPATTAGCSVTFGGRIQAGDDKATFAGTAVTSAHGVARGESEHHDHGGGLVVRSDEIQAVVCDEASGRATVYGTATVGGEPVGYRLQVTDLAEPGAGVDTYGLLLASGYDPGEAVLEGGNVQVRVR